MYLTVLEAGNLRSRCQHGPVLVKALFLVHSRGFFTVSSHDRRRKGALWGSLRTIISFTKVPPSWAKYHLWHHLLKSTIILGLRISTYEWRGRGAGNIQTTVDAIHYYIDNLLVPKELFSSKSALTTVHITLSLLHRLFFFHWNINYFLCSINISSVISEWSNSLLYIVYICNDSQIFILSSRLLYLPDHWTSPTRNFTSTWNTKCPTLNFLLNFCCSVIYLLFSFIWLHHQWSSYRYR